MAVVKVLLVDPMSRMNLGVYDKNLLENIYGEKYFFASDGFQFVEILNTTIIYNYFYYNKKGLLKIASYFYSQIKLLKWVFVNDLDIIHIQWLRLPLYDLVILLLIKILKRKIKIIYTAHNILPHNATGKRWIFYEYYILYHLFDGIVVHADKTRKELIKLFNLNNVSIKEIPHGVLRYQIAGIKENIYHGKIVFSMTGMMNYYKGVDILIDAWISNKMLMENDTIHLIIAGTGKIPHIEKIPEKSNITVINKLLTNEEYQLIIDNTDVGILPYRQISQSGVLLSLLAQHKPVIVSDCGGLTQPFTIGRVGWILNELSTNILSEIIYKIVQNKEELLGIQNDINLWKEIDRYYSWENIGKSTNDFYNSLITQQDICKTRLYQ